MSGYISPDQITPPIRSRVALSGYPTSVKFASPRAVPTAVDKAPASKRIITDPANSGWRRSELRTRDVNDAPSSPRFMPHFAKVQGLTSAVDFGVVLIATHPFRPEPVGPARSRFQS